MSTGGAELIRAPMHVAFTCDYNHFITNTANKYIQLYVQILLINKHYNLARSAKLPEGLYILPMFFLYFFYFFFSGRPRSHAGSEANGPIFTKISGLVDN